MSIDGEARNPIKLLTLARILQYALTRVKTPEDRLSSTEDEMEARIVGRYER
jgi:hypothetical protein